MDSDEGLRHKAGKLSGTAGVLYARLNACIEAGVFLQTIVHKACKIKEKK